MAAAKPEIRTFLCRSDNIGVLMRDPATGAEACVVRFAEPVRAVSPGQMAVAYHGDRVLGGGRIQAALPARAEELGRARSAQAAEVVS